MKKLWDEFKKFAFKGNVLDMAIGVIIGGAFGAIVTSLINDLLMPAIGLLIKTDFSKWFIALDGNTYESLEAAKEAGAGIFHYGNFISAIVYFFMVAICIFIVVKALNTAKKKAEDAKKKLSNLPLKSPTSTNELITPNSAVIKRADAVSIHRFLKPTLPKKTNKADKRGQ